LSAGGGSILDCLLQDVIEEPFNHEAQKTLDTLPPCRHGRAIVKAAFLSKTRRHTMEAESTTRKDSLKFEKRSLLVLTLCVVVLFYVLIFRPF
jgi:hypothetical protein